MTKPASERASFELIYREHFAFVWRALARLGVPERDLNDAAQDVFVVVHRKLPEFDFESRVTTWIYAICLRVASDARKSARSRLEVLGDTPPLPRIGPDGDESQVHATYHRRLLGAALDVLPLEQRAVFVLFELDGMTGDEVAALLAVPLATVHSRLRLARLSVRRTLSRAREHETFTEKKLGGRP